MTRQPIPSMRPDPPRDPVTGWYLFGDQSWQRATSLAKIPDDTFHLDRWKDRKLMEGFRIDPRLLEEVRADPRTRAERESQAQLAQRARRIAGAEQGSDDGTDLHTLSEWLDAGRIDEIEVPGRFRADLGAYQDALYEAGISIVGEFIERVVINETVGVAGTFDRLVRDRDGVLRIFDLKTQKTVDFGWASIAAQLATYAYASHIEHPASSGELVPMVPEVDKTMGLVAHLPVGQARCTIWEVDLESGWYVARVAAQIRDIRKDSRSMGRPHRPTPPKVDAASNDQLMHLIKTCPHPLALEALWEKTARQAWTPAHIEAARVRKSELLPATNTAN